MEENDIKQLSAQEQMFADSYLIVPQKVKAALSAGYAPDYAKQIGYEVYNRPHVKAYIEKRLSELTASRGEVVKLMNDMAFSNMADYFVPVQEIRQEKLIVGLSELIDSMRDEIDSDEQFAAEKGYTAEEFDKFQEGIQWKRDNIIKWKIELRKNPLATRIIDGPKELVTVMQLDINQVIADKDRGKIKSVKYTKDGIQVEGYDAQSAADKLLRVHGAYEKDNEQLKNSLSIETAKITFK